MTLDASRFAYRLAGLLIAGEWELNQLRFGIRIAMEAHHRRAPKQLAERLLAAFPTAPPFERLAKFLLNDRRLASALRRGISSLALGNLSGETPRYVPVRLRDLSIPKLQSEPDVARWLGIEVRHLRWYADIAGRNRLHPAGALRLYRHRWIPRRGRLPRLLEIPKVGLKRIQRKILDEILNRVPFHDAVHGFRVGRSILTNATPHCGKSIVIRFDLTDFFPSIDSARVTSMFRAIGYPPGVARVLTGLCTTLLPPDVWEARPGARDGADFVVRQRLITRHLPQGAPTSPALANLVAHRLDRRLTGLARTGDAIYTRYADDLTFSGGADLARSRKRFAAHVAFIAQEEGFVLNFRKTRSFRAGVRQEVTGVVVNVRPNIPRDDFDRLKAILTNCVRHGAHSQNRTGVPDFRAHLAGRIAFIASIHPGRGVKLKRMFDQIQWP